MSVPERPKPLKSSLLVPESYLGKTSKRAAQTDNSAIDDSEYWWSHTPAPSPESPAFERVDDQLILNRLRAQIDRRELPIIEIPANVMRTLKILDDPDFTYNDVIGLIEHSPAMAGEFIKIINSSFYGSGITVRDLKAALPRLGKTKLKSLLFIYSSRMNFLGSKQFNNIAVDIVEHSYAVGLIASYLSQRLFADPDIAFLAGLLHDIGKLAIIKGVSETHAIPADLGFALSETTFQYIFPELHEKAGLLVAENWKLEDDVKIAILHHHDLKLTGIKSRDPELTLHLCQLINLSDTMARMLGKGRALSSPVNLFDLPSAIGLGLEKDWNTVEFLNDIPAVVNFKLDR